jgi:hypothetical protein
MVDGKLNVKCMAEMNQFKHIFWRFISTDWISTLEDGYRCLEEQLHAIFYAAETHPKAHDNVYFWRDRRRRIRDGGT